MRSFGFEVVSVTQLRFALPMYTPGFAAPEACKRDGAVGAWTDAYAIGACLLACMSAKAPLLQKTNSEWYMATGYTDWHGQVFFLDTQATVGYAHLTGSRTIDLDGFIRTANNTRPAEYLAGGATAGAKPGDGHAHRRRAAAAGAEGGR